ncbi:phosphotransferase family protein [Embleya sp. AB8]|uniref:phosphotransferase family protein n=1 Tax=Embleya sp. AB8 TaxID=3156304 RepID=UPI003C764491
MTGDVPGIAAVRAIAARHGVPPAQVLAVPGGAANHAYTLGSSLFLRIPRGDGFVADLEREAVVIPAARRAGVRTPAVVDFDASRALVEVPFLVTERVAGVDLALADVAGERRVDVLREAGRQLARLHRVTEASVGPLAGVAPDDGGDPRPQVTHLARAGYLDPGTADWLTGWFDRLEHRFPAGSACLLHGDVAPQNLLVDPVSAAFRGLVDWGDSCWGEPGMEFAKLDLFDVVSVLAGYRAEGGGTADDDGALEARALWYHLGWGVPRAAVGKPQPNRRHWTAPPLSRLLGLVRFLASAPPAPWSTLG